MTPAEIIRNTTRIELEWFVESLGVRAFRPMGQFAEEEIVIPPGGPHGDKPFRLDRQPFSRSWFAEVDSHRWREHYAIGPVQSGKTLDCTVIPAMYHLFEIKENVILGIPDMNMANDKWNDDFLPVIRASRYRHLMPTSGPGSKGGGKITVITFRNGRWLRFMSAKGAATSRAGKTVRVLIFTELAAFGDVQATSNSSNPFNQLLGRIESHGDRGVVYGEGTVTTKSNIAWNKYQTGTASQILVPCPKCNEFVCPERSHLMGCQDQTNVIDAGQAARFMCPNPDCGVLWTAEEREVMNLKHVLVHRGQTVGTDGSVMGDAPKTRTLGFRWNGFNNLFKTVGKLGEQEWDVMSSGKDEDEVKHRQDVWAMPIEPTEFDRISLTYESVQQRIKDVEKEGLTRGISPVNTEFLTGGVDCGDHLFHWTIIGTMPLGPGQWFSHVVNYGMLENPTQELGIEVGYRVAFQKLYDLMEGGFTIHRLGETWAPWQVFIDSNWKSDEVHRAINKLGNRYRATQGRGKGQFVSGDYHEPTKTTQNIVEIGERWHVVYLPERDSELVAFDTNHFKSAIHDGLRIPRGNPGSLSIFHATQQEHTKFAHHLIAERDTVVIDPKKGMVREWKRDGYKANHYLDSTALAMVAQRFCLQQLAKQAEQAQAVQPASRSLIQRPANSGLGVALGRA